MADDEKPTEVPEKVAEEKKKPGCCGKTLRFIAGILLSPVALVFGIIAVLVWIVLLPIKCICPCCSPCLTLITEGMLGMAKGFCRLLGFACKSGDDEKSDEEMDVIASEKSNDYGSTAKKEEVDETDAEKPEEKPAGDGPAGEAEKPAE